MLTCYMCHKPATSAEHAPPKCFFPEAKDLPAGVDYRKNLITVPSCEDHNNASSRDDEYALVVVASHFENNDIAGHQYSTKILRALTRSTGLVVQTFRDRKEVTVNGRPSIAFKVDDIRFARVLEKTARAIYYHETGDKWVEEIHVHPVAFRDGDMSQMAEIVILRGAGRALMQGEPERGENPDIFFYQLIRDLRMATTVLRMVFYRGFEVFAVSKPRAY